jgi:hypothetical protein
MNEHAGQGVPAFGKITEPDALAAAVQHAARALPENFLLAINVERGAGWAEVIALDFHFSPDGAGMTLSEQVLACVEAAKIEGEKRGAKS